MRALRTVAITVALLATLVLAPSANADIPHNGAGGWATVDEGTGWTYYVPLAPLYTTELKSSGYGWVPTVQDNKKFVAAMTGNTVNYVFVWDICGSGFVWVWYENRWWTAYANMFTIVPGYGTQQPNWRCATAA